MSQAEATRQQATAEPAARRTLDAHGWLHPDGHHLDGLMVELDVRDEHVASPTGSTGNGRQVPPASALIEEADAVNEATGDRPLISTSLVLAAWRGQETRALELVEASIQDATPRGEANAISLAGYAIAVLYNGLGRYQPALAAGQRACEREGVLSMWVVPELVEASARSGSPGVAWAALRRLEERTRAGGADWALGIQTQSRALLSDGEHADVLYQEALEQLANSRITLHLARAQLLYGEWLRREGRRVDARKQLRAVHGLFSRIGAEGFAERARRELLATGETVRKRSVETRDDLTAREAQIAHLAGDGYTNPEIGAELFISPRTVEWHLRKVFSKLGIGSRKQLRGACSDAGRAAVPAFSHSWLAIGAPGMEPVAHPGATGLRPYEVEVPSRGEPVLPTNYPEAWKNPPERALWA